MDKPKMEPVYASTYEELFEKRQYLRATDIMKLFDVGRTKASEIIASIKHVSDIAHVKGRVTVSDYVAWYNQYPTSAARG